MAKFEEPDSLERIDSPYPRKLPDEQPEVRWRQLTCALSCIVWYPIASVLLFDLEESVAVAIAVVMPFIIAYYSKAAFRSWPRRIVTFLVVLCVCWLVSDSLWVIAQGRRSSERANGPAMSQSRATP